MPGPAVWDGASSGSAPDAPVAGEPSQEQPSTLITQPAASSIAPVSAEEATAVPGEPVTPPASGNTCGAKYAQCGGCVSRRSRRERRKLM